MRGATGGGSPGAVGVCPVLKGAGNLADLRVGQKETGLARGQSSMVPGNAPCGPCLG